MNGFFKNTERVNQALLKYDLAGSIDYLSELRFKGRNTAEMANWLNECTDANEAIIEGHKLYKRGEVDSAIEAFQSIVDSERSNTCTGAMQGHALQSKAWLLYIEKGYTDEALSSFYGALRLTQDPGVTALVESQLCLIKTARPDKGDAEAHCVRASQLSDSPQVGEEIRIDVLLNVATVAHSGGSVTEARRQLSKAESLCRGIHDCPYADEIDEKKRDFA